MGNCRIWSKFSPKPFGQEVSALGGELSDAQWAIVAPPFVRLRPPLIPTRNQKGRPRADDRGVLDGTLYVLRTGCRWQDLPSGFSHPSTVWRRLRRWIDKPDEGGFYIQLPPLGLITCPVTYLASSDAR